MQTAVAASVVALNKAIELAATASVPIIATPTTVKANVSLFICSQPVQA